MENPNYFPEDILIEIFSRLPAKSVGKFRCVSKSWRTNLSTSQFVNLHLGRQKDRTILLLVEGGCIHTLRTPPANDDDDSLVKLDIPDLSVGRFLGSSNGLVLLLGSKVDEIFVVNPLTLQYLSVQNKPQDDKYSFPHVEYGFGYDRVSDDYKIVKLSRYFGHTHPTPSTQSEFVDVYSLRKGVWKRLDTSYFRDISFEGTGVLLNGNVHWLAPSNTDGDDKYVIATFDLATESFCGIPAPKVPMNGINYRVLAIGGCLVVMDVGGFADMWIMKEYGSVNSWTYSPITSPLHAEYFVVDLFPVEGKETKALVLTDFESLIVWNVANGTTKDILDKDGNTATLSAHVGVGTFMESLVSPIQYVVAS